MNTQRVIPISIETFRKAGVSEPLIPILHYLSTLFNMSELASYPNVKQVLKCKV